MKLLLLHVSIEIHKLGSLRIRLETLWREIVMTFFFLVVRTVECQCLGSAKLA